MTPETHAALIARLHSMNDRLLMMGSDYANVIFAAIAALHAAGARETWQPIETAPKDGTVVLLWWPY